MASLLDLKNKIKGGYIQAIINNIKPGMKSTGVAVCKACIKINISYVFIYIQKVLLITKMECKVVAPWSKEQSRVFNNRRLMPDL